MKAQDIMSTKVATVGPQTLLNDVAALMLARDVSGLPVVDENGKVVGVISEGDLMRRAENRTDTTRSWWLRLISSQADESKAFIKTHGLNAGEVMSHPVVTAGIDDDVAVLAHELEKRGIKRLPIVADGRLVGIVSRADILRAMAADAAFARPAKNRSDRDIREAFLACVSKESWAQSAVVNPVVSDGVVHLWGVVEDNDQRKALLTAARSLDGVKAVEDHLGAEIPI
ncbi:MAG: CBS domain-containing protein [Gammaproteobacteria bacterium]